MKTSLTYGFLMALGGALVTLALFFAGLHDRADRVDTAQWIEGCLGLAISFACLYLALRDSRENAGTKGNDWLFGSAFGAGVGTAGFAALFGGVFRYVYYAMINPDFGTVMKQAQVAKMETLGAPEAQIEAQSKFMERLMNPPILTISGMVGGFIVGMVLAAHVAIAMTRRHSRAVLFRYYAVFGLVLGPLIGFSQGAQHRHALLGFGLGFILGPLVEVAIAAIVLAIAKYEPAAPPNLAAVAEAGLPPTLA